jgi:hypothetical protein
MSAAQRALLSQWETHQRKIWEIALGLAEHEDLSLAALRDLAQVVLKDAEHADPSIPAIFAPAIVRACAEKDRGELSRELLKLFPYVIFSKSLDDDLSREDKLAAFAGRHAPAPDEHFATVWNRPGTEDLEPAERARRLLKDLGSTSVENALRRVRRMVTRGWDMAGYRKGPDGRAKQIS